MTAQPMRVPGPEEQGREIQFRWSQAEDLAGRPEIRAPDPEAGGAKSRLPGQAVEGLGIVKGVAQYLMDMRAEG